MSPSFPVILLPLLAAATAPLEITLDPQPGKFFAVTFAGPSSGLDGGAFHGSLVFNGSAAEMPLVGQARRLDDRLLLSAALRYADVPSDWAARLTPEGFECHVHGEVEGSGPLSWTGTLRWDEIGVKGGAQALSAFVKLASLQLTALSTRRGEGRVAVTIFNPFSFPVTLESSSQEIRLGGEKVGWGTARGKILRSGRKNWLELPFIVERGLFLASAGPAWAAGGELDAELRARLTLRFSFGKISVPFTARGSMGTDGVRSGPEALPEGTTSLAPHR